jgi:serine/threonine protein kinase
MAAPTRSCPRCRRSYADSAFFCGADGAITVQDQSPDDFDPRLGQLVGGYVIAARVADGAMGRVFEGRHPETKLRVAIKILHSSVARDAVAAQRFRREYETTRTLRHPHIVAMIESGETQDGAAFLAMEYLEGAELGRLLGRGRPLPHARIVRIIAQVALALEHAHSFGLVHRDLKPENIFLCHGTDGDHVRVLDFGSVKLQAESSTKLTAVGTAVGSPFYMSPEQAIGQADVDHASDVFALGAILYEMLTDQVAFEAPNVARILLRILHDEPSAPSLVAASPPALDSVVQKALAKLPSDRYPTARAFAEAVVAGFGLSGDLATWATRPQLVIETELGQSTLVGDRSPMPVQSPTVPVPEASHAPRLGLATDDRIRAPRPGQRRTSTLAVLALGLMFACGLLVLWLR